jgi:hypothetical protein
LGCSKNSRGENALILDAEQSFDWKSILLGKEGLLTTIFNDFKERHKQDLSKPKPNLPQADLTPEQNDFAKLFEAFLQKAKSGNFDEPLPELPFIGICNRLSCGDIYKAVDQFRQVSASINAIGTVFFSV